MDERRRLRMDAMMDGQRVIAETIGKKRKVSEMELMALCNFAKIGFLHLCSLLDGEIGEEAGEELQKFIEVVRERFSDNGSKDGVARLSQCVAAMLKGERFARYTFEVGEPS